MSKSKNFVFDGGAATYFVTGILSWLTTVFTLGLGYPWSLCLSPKWRAKHTYIQGRQLVFTGGCFSLIELWIKWMILLIITFGIYSFWLITNLNKWIVEHTDFADSEPTNGKDKLVSEETTQA